MLNYNISRSFFSLLSYYYARFRKKWELYKSAGYIKVAGDVSVCEFQQLRANHQFLFIHCFLPQWRQWFPFSRPWGISASNNHRLRPRGLLTSCCCKKKNSVKGGAANMWLNLTHFALITIYYFFFSVSFLGLSCFAFVGPCLSTTTFPVCTDMQGRGSADCFKRLDWAIHCQ